ncbi:MAG: hypothetical protein ACR2GH_00830 [Pseudonocardia sp.]
MVAGEYSNDRKCLRILLEAFCPDMRGRIVEISDSVRLRQARSATLTSRIGTLLRKAHARAARDDAVLACLFVHEDLDVVDGTAYIEARKRVQAELERASGFGHYVLAAWEVEAWLIMFPEALTAHVSAWKLPAKYRKIDTGLLADPKRLLGDVLGKDGRRYREADAADVLARAVELGQHVSPQSMNRSWRQLESDAVACCAAHLPSHRR